MDDTQAEESTDNRLLYLEERYSTRVRIYPAGLWEVEVNAYGHVEKIKLAKTVNGFEHKLTDREIEHEIDLTIERLRQRKDDYQYWNQWCRRNGLS